MPIINFTVRKLDSIKPQATRVDYYDDSLPGFVMRVTPGGEKTFSVLYRIGGLLRRYTLGAFPVLELATARERAKDALELVRHGVDPAEEHVRREESEVARWAEGFTFEMLAKQFIEEHVKKLRSSYEVKRSFDQYLLPQFGKIKARELKRAAVPDYLDNIAQTRPVMANRCLAYIRKMYNWALSKDSIHLLCTMKHSSFRPCPVI